jgi:hypothetical protein
MSMTSREAPRRIRRDISIQQVGAETLIYDERRHQAFCLNESSSVIWKLADGARTIAEICVEASVELQTAVSEDFVLFALAELRREGLVEEASVVEAGPAVSRRALLRGIGIGSALLLPAVAAIVAPTAAQAYSGCFDCTSSQATRAAKARRQQSSGSKK